MTGSIDTIRGAGLLLCPFHDSDRAHNPTIKEMRSVHGAASTWYVCCPCGVLGPNRDNEEKAIAAWNRRASRLTASEGGELPEGCPETVEWDVDTQRIIFHPVLVGFGFDGGSITVELHPVGTRDRLRDHSTPLSDGISTLLESAAYLLEHDIPIRQGACGTPSHVCDDLCVQAAGVSDIVARLRSVPRLRASTAPRGWQPMEMAPRDGRQVLAIGKTGDAYVVLCRNGVNEWYMREGDCYRDPVAWMPLPRLPPAPSHPRGGAISKMETTTPPSGQGKRGEE